MRPRLSLCSLALPEIYIALEVMYSLTGEEKENDTGFGDYEAAGHKTCQNLRLPRQSYQLCDCQGMGEGHGYNSTLLL